MKPVVLTTLLALTLCACHRHETAAASPGLSSSQTATGTQAAPPTGPPTQPPPEAVIVPDNADVNATLDDLSTQLRAYVSSTRSRPKDFQDFIARARVQAPPPPSGQAYALSGAKVVLVKR